MRTAAIVLSGGTSSRMGVPKTAETVGGRTLLARVTDALSAVDRIVVVGPVGDDARADVTTCEDPPGGGPVAAVAQGIGLIDSDVAFVLAGDLAFLTSAALATMAGALASSTADAAVALDDRGRDQYLLAAWRTGALQRALAALGDPAGQSLRRLYAGASTVRVRLAGHPPPWWDCDTPADLERARVIVAGPHPDPGN